MNNDTTSKSLVVAEHILFLRKGQLTTTLQLIKLVYLCHGWMLGLLGKNLLDEGVEAWKYGPVVKSVYDKYRAYGKDGITIPPKDQSGLLTAEEKGIVESVVNAYAKYTPWQLSSITHQKGTPWHRVYREDSHPYSYIPDEDIKAYYQKLAKVQQ